MNVVIVPLELLGRVWDRASVELQKALEHTRTDLDLDYVWGALLARSMQLWGVVERNTPGARCWCVTELYTDEVEKVIRVRLAAGFQHQDWIHLLANVERFGAIQGATRCEVVGRRGWERALKPQGYELDWVVLSKEISERTN